jgi:ABC-2 type transport system permease protein
LESNAIRLNNNYTGAYDPAKGFIDNSRQMLSQLEQFKQSLFYNIDRTGNGKPLSPDDRVKFKNNAAVLTYKLNHHIDVENETGSSSKTAAVEGMTGIGFFGILLLLIILAGSSVSQEIATGSIKSLIISPARRWKIFVAKYLSLITVGLIGALITFVIFSLTYGIFFGFDSGKSYINAHNGNAFEIPFYLYQLGGVLADCIKLLVFMTFALMLSVITRNTAAAVAVSIAIGLTFDIVTQFLQLLARGEWVRFLPFFNLDFKKTLFPSQLVEYANPILGAAVKNSLLFMLIYTAVLLICMFYIALDSFNRRDIK